MEVGWEKAPSCRAGRKSIYLDPINPKELLIATLEGVMRAKVGDYIIKGVNGDLYPCKSDIFEKTFEIVSKD